MPPPKTPEAVLYPIRRLTTPYMLTESRHNVFLLWDLCPQFPVLQAHTLHLLLAEARKELQW